MCLRAPCTRCPLVSMYSQSRWPHRTNGSLKTGKRGNEITVYTSYHCLSCVQHGEKFNFCSCLSFYLLERLGDSDYDVKAIDADGIPSVMGLSVTAIDDTNVKAITGEAISAPNRLIVTNDNHAALAVGFPDLLVSAGALFSCNLTLEILSHVSPALSCPSGGFLPDTEFNQSPSPYPAFCMTTVQIQPSKN